MAKTASLTSPVAQRYAASLFDLAQEANAVDAIEGALDNLLRLIKCSEDLRRLIMSATFSKTQQAEAMKAVVAKFSFTKNVAHLVGNFCQVLAANRRLFLLVDCIHVFKRLVAALRGEVVVEVTAAQSLNASQEKELKTALQEAAGKDVRLHITVDSSILGGLIVRLGSKQIDTSLITKLSRLKLVLKEVG
ncbi:F0F1 ATP synthase subunit delta [Bartonella sp. DGB2]|uniref:F0F1 ATP synthase subunit delta n=1 Tax=Bartonella sp. DGB2 TaxID=3388426 RepID=UPI003990359C